MDDPSTIRPGTPVVGGAGLSTGNDEPPRNEIGWIRSTLSAVAIVALGFVGAVWVPNVIITKLDSPSSFVRSLLAGGLVVLVVVAMAWGLRRLQARRLI